MKRQLVTIAFALSLGATSAQSEGVAAITPSQDEWTVLTMAPDGSWGAATDFFISRAIADAIAMCRRTSGQQLGCGAAFRSIRAGWSLGIRCGQENILVADHDLEDAERTARERELKLRYVYAAELGPCRRVVTVNPEGRIVAPESQVALPDARATGP